MKNSKKNSLLLSVLIILILSTYLLWQNNAIEVSYFNFSEDTIPKEFDGYKIVQVSDLHNKNFRNQLTNKVTEENPDIIVVTGDVIDRNRTDIPVAVEALENFVDIAPVYFVTGNHEVLSGQFDLLQEEMDRIGVVNLDNSYDTLFAGDSEISLIGIEDPLLILYENIEDIGFAELSIQGTIEKQLNKIGTDFNILLSHRAELLHIYSKTSIDIALTGHAHGGQIRLPFIGGVYSPSQGLLPEYTNGMYEDNGTKMVVSRGLGNSIFPFRISNRPELVVVTLESE